MPAASPVDGRPQDQAAALLIPIELNRSALKSSGLAFRQNWPKLTA
jgi:hypothetical protein